MGLFKKLVGDIAKSVGESLEEAKNEAKKNFEEARDEAIRNLQETKRDIINSDDDDVKIQLGSYENGVLTIDEGHTSLNEDSLEGYKNIRKVVFPSTLKEIEGGLFLEHEKYLEEVDFSKVTMLKEIPDDLFESCTRLKEIIFPEGVETIGSEVYNNCESLRKITFPSTLKSLDSTTCGCKKIEEIDISKVHHLDKIPEDFISENCRLQILVIPEGVKKIGAGFASSESIKEIYIPDSVEEVSYTSEEEGRTDMYLYSNKLTDIESLCGNVDTLYVPEILYTYYAELLKKAYNTDTRLRKMPADKLDFYGPYVPVAPMPPKTEEETIEEVSPEEESSEEKEVIISEDVCESTPPSMPEMPKESAPTLEQTPQVQEIKKSPGNLFSDGLEELINSVAESDEITDKKKEIILRRAVKEGEDPDEVEMILEARFYEAHNK